MTVIEEKLLSVIGKGEENAIKQEEITRLTGLSARDTRAIIERLRAGGMVICSSNAGRFFPENIEELDSYVKRIQASGKGVLYHSHTKTHDLTVVSVALKSAVPAGDAVIAVGVVPSVGFVMLGII